MTRNQLYPTGTVGSNPTLSSSRTLDLTLLTVDGTRTSLGAIQRFVSYRRRFAALPFKRGGQEGLITFPFFYFSLFQKIKRRGGRAVEGARLESVCRLIPYRGFESLPLRSSYEEG